MKKILIFTLAALAALVSCQKENLQTESSIGESLVFSATIDNGDTKATIAVDGTFAKIKWEATDEITITDASSNKAVYKVSSGAGTPSATFTIKEGETALGAGPYTASFGEEPSPDVAQIYSAAASIPIYMTAPSSETTDLSFSAQCGVLDLKLTDATHGVIRIVVSDGTNDYTLNFSDEVAIASEKDFYLVLPTPTTPTTYTSVKVFDNTGSVAVKSGLSIQVSRGHVKPARTSTLSFASGTTGITGGHAWVQLWESGPKWAETNIGASTPEDYGYYFAWGYDDGGCKRNAGNDGWVLASDGTTTKKFNNTTTGYAGYQTHSYADMAASAWGGVWRLPTDAESATLINSDSSNKCSVTSVTSGIKGIRITGTGKYASNSIFLPAAGNGNSANILNLGIMGCYWSATQTDGANANSFRFKPEDSSFASLNSSNKYSGRSVRPVL
jgi:Fibrobacter succinogenes major domain (Fib_succ_major).